MARFLSVRRLHRRRWSGRTLPPRRSESEDPYTREVPMKRTQRLSVIVATMMLVLQWSSGALAQVVGLDWKVQYVTTTPSGAPSNPIVVGAQMKVRCEWTATIAKSGNMPQPIQWTGFLLVDGKMIKKITAKYEAKSGWFYEPG